jgi:ABC-type multidrug transport system fused ATPase/permease subunit
MILILKLHEVNFEIAHATPNSAHLYVSLNFKHGSMYPVIRFFIFDFGFIRLEQSFLAHFSLYLSQMQQTTDANIITITNLSHAFAGKTVLKNINLSTCNGKFIAVPSPSGCGKQT